MQWLTDNPHGAVLFLLLAVLVGLLLYFLPTLLAWTLGGTPVLRMLWVNALLAWTVLGWVICLVWVLIHSPDQSFDAS